MRSEFLLMQVGFMWALYNYKGELIYASLNPRTAIKVGAEMIKERKAIFCPGNYIHYVDFRERKEGTIFGT